MAEQFNLVASAFQIGEVVIVSVDSIVPDGCCVEITAAGRGEGR